MKLLKKIFILFTLFFVVNSAILSQVKDTVDTGKVNKNLKTVENISRLKDICLSVGVIPFYPAIYGMKTEIAQDNISLGFTIIYLPDANLFSSAASVQPLRIKDISLFTVLNLHYNFVISRNIYLFSGFYGMIQFRKTHEYQEENDRRQLLKNDYYGFSYGAIAGAKEYFFDHLFFEQGIFAGVYPIYKPIEGKVISHKINVFPFFTVNWKF